MVPSPLWHLICRFQHGGAVDKTDVRDVEIAAFVLPAAGYMWTAAPEIATNIFERMAQARNTQEEELFAKQEHQHSKKARRAH